MSKAGSNAAIGTLLMMIIGCAAAKGAASQSGAALFAGAGATAAPPVEVVLYAEALCPFCASLLTDVVAPLLNEPGFDAAIHFRYVAWGNAHNTSEGVRCQHGPAECRLDRAISCATHLAKDRSLWLPFLSCLEAAPAPEREAAVDSCAQAAGLDGQAIQECADGPLGEELERRAAQETGALDPPHTYVPWLTVQGIPLGDLDAELKTFVCVAYTGERPPGCFGPPPGSAAAARLPASRGARSWRSGSSSSSSSPRDDRAGGNSEQAA